MSEGAKKIIEGLKEAAQHAVCDHDWEVVEARSGFQGTPMRLSKQCPYCGAQMIEYVKSR